MSLNELVEATSRPVCCAYRAIISARVGKPCQGVTGPMSAPSSGHAESSQPRSLNGSPKVVNSQSTIAASCGPSAGAMTVIGIVRNVASEFWDEPVTVANRHITSLEPIIEAATAN